MKKQTLSQNQFCPGRAAWRGLASLVRAGGLLVPIAGLAGPVGLSRGYGGGVVYGQDVSNYEERTLTIEVFDNHTKDLTWVGWSKRDAIPLVDVEKLQAGIRSILAQFPPGATAPTR